MSDYTQQLEQQNEQLQQKLAKAEEYQDWLPKWEADKKPCGPTNKEYRIYWYCSKFVMYACVIPRFVDGADVMFEARFIMQPKNEPKLSAYHKSLEDAKNWVEEYIIYKKLLYNDTINL